jgi:hypothetical protein
MRKLALTLATAAVAVVGGYGATLHGASADASLPPNWHVHDGQVTLGAQHKGIGFFPRILGISTSQYLQDPARCPNATDKAFLPSSGEAQSDLLRAGVCETNTDVIHLRTVLLGTAGPDGWSSLTTRSEPGWVTYYLVTTR